ncbi:MAG TPA: hypothetical protein VGU67_02745 [Edaphobacter sp.]|nr:hypothetical protein [Edaphobacter sp.]
MRMLHTVKTDCRYCAWCEEPILSHSRFRLMWHNLICWFTALPTSHVQVLAERAAVERTAKDGNR